MTIVVDASVASKWFLPAESGAAAARKALDRIVADPSTFVVPELFFNEMLAVLVRLQTLDTKAIETALAVLEQLGLRRVGNGHELLACAAQLARRYRLTGYDAIYVATAELVGGTWLTADAAAAARIDRPSLVTLLDDFQ